VNVYLRQPDFSEAEIPTLMVALKNWDQSAAENGSNVHFVFRSLSREAKLGLGDLSIIRGQTYDKKLKHLARLEAYSLGNNQLIDCALIIVDPRVKHTKSLINTIAHEVGHSLGLLDCYRCKEKSTAMGLISTADGPHGIEGPTTCDKMQVLAGYQELKQRPGSVSAALATDDSQHPSPHPDDRHPLVMNRKSGPWSVRIAL
jgi:hypothetical protein